MDSVFPGTLRHGYRHSPCRYLEPEQALGVEVVYVRIVRRCARGIPREPAPREAGPSGLHDQARVHVPAARDLVHVADETARVARAIPQARAHPFVLIGRQPHLAVLEEHVHVRSRIERQAIAGGVDVRASQRAEHPGRAELPAARAVEGVEAVVLAVPRIAIAGGEVVHEVEAGRPGRGEGVADVHVLEPGLVREIPGILGAGRGARAAELADGLELEVPVPRGRLPVEAYPRREQAAVGGGPVGPIVLVEMQQVDLTVHEGDEVEPLDVPPGEEGAGFLLVEGVHAVQDGLCFIGETRHRLEAEELHLPVIVVVAQADDGAGEGVDGVAEHVACDQPPAVHVAKVQRLSAKLHFRIHAAAGDILGRPGAVDLQEIRLVDLGVGDGDAGADPGEGGRAFVGEELAGIEELDAHTETVVAGLDPGAVLDGQGMVAPFSAEAEGAILALVAAAVFDCEGQPLGQLRGLVQVVGRLVGLAGADPVVLHRRVAVDGLREGRHRQPPGRVLRPRSPCRNGDGQHGRDEGVGRDGGDQARRGDQ